VLFRSAMRLVLVLVAVSGMHALKQMGGQMGSFDPQQMQGFANQMPQMGQEQMGAFNPQQMQGFANQMPQMGAFDPQQMQGYANQMPSMGQEQMPQFDPQNFAQPPQQMQGYPDFQAMQQQPQAYDPSQAQPQMGSFPQMPQIPQMGMGAPAQGFPQMPQFPQMGMGAQDPQMPQMGMGAPAQGFPQMSQGQGYPMQQALAPNINTLVQGQQFGSPFAPSGPQFYPPTGPVNNLPPEQAAANANMNFANNLQTQTGAGNGIFPGMAGQNVAGGNPSAMMYHPYVNPMTLGMMPYSYMPPPPGPAPYPFPSFNPPNYYNPSNEFVG